MDHTLVQGAPRNRVHDGGVLEAEGGDGEGHDGARRERVASRLVRSVDLLFRREGITAFLQREGGTVPVMAVVDSGC